MESKKKAGIADIKISKEQQQELIKLSRAANRRLERASAGQRRSLEYNLAQYHTKRTSRGLVFEQGKAKTEREYKQRMKELEAFMKAKTSTKTGWKKLEASNLEAAIKKLDLMQYKISVNELKIVLQEIGGSSKEFYKALENIEAKRSEKLAAIKKAKEKSGEDFDENMYVELNREEIIEAITSRRSDYQATLAAIKARTK